MSDLIKYSDVSQYQLMVLPVCGTHGIQMEYRKTEGECEAWGGVWYDCPKCFSSVVFKADQEKHVSAQEQSAGGWGVSVISEYKDSSGLTTYPTSLTDHVFAGLNEQENIDFKIWLGLIGENEIEVAVDQKLETYFVKAFKEQKEERCQYMNPAQKTSLISFWFLQAEADKACAALPYGCEFWQLVDWVPTQEELNKAFPAPESLELEYAPPMEPVKSEPVKQVKAKGKPVRDEWTLDLFGGVA